MASEDFAAGFGIGTKMGESLKKGFDDFRQMYKDRQDRDRLKSQHVPAMAELENELSKPSLSPEEMEEFKTAASLIKNYADSSEIINEPIGGVDPKTYQPIETPIVRTPEGDVSLERFLLLNRKFQIDSADRTNKLVDGWMNILNQDPENPHLKNIVQNKMSLLEMSIKRRQEAEKGGMEEFLKLAAESRKDKAAIDLQNVQDKAAMDRQNAQDKAAMERENAQNRAAMERVRETGNQQRITDDAQAEKEKLKLKLTPGEEASDKEFGKVAAELNFSNVENNMEVLSNIQKRLEAGEDLTGKIYGLLPDNLKPFVDEEGADVIDQVRGVIYQSLKETLGAQFTEKEGERLVKSAYNPQLSPELNAKRLAQGIQNIQDKISEQRAKVEYFEENGTLKGFKRFQENPQSDEDGKVSIRSKNGKVIKTTPESARRLLDQGQATLVETSNEESEGNKEIRVIKGQRYQRVADGWKKVK